MSEETLDELYAQAKAILDEWGKTHPSMASAAHKIAAEKHRTGTLTPKYINKLRAAKDATQSAQRDAWRP